MKVTQNFKKKCVQFFSLARCVTKIHSLFSKVSFQILTKTNLKILLRSANTHVTTLNIIANLSPFPIYTILLESTK